MPCPHNEITIVQRSQRQSAVAAAAYQSGEKLFCEYDQQVKHYPEKRGIVHNEILLPANAPRSYADRNTLWNAAEAVEKQWNSQLARRWGSWMAKSTIIPLETNCCSQNSRTRTAYWSGGISLGMVSTHRLASWEFHCFSTASAAFHRVLRSAYFCGAFAGSRISLWTIPRFSG